MKVRYQYRLFFYFAIVLVIVVAGFSIFIMKRERAHNLKAMQSELISYNSMVYQAIERNVAYDSISFQDKVRITIIDTSGAVLFDNLGPVAYKENQMDRPEIVKAKQDGAGTYLRGSHSVNEEYLFYARRYPNLYVRTALTYRTEVLPKIMEDRKYLFGIAFLFLCLVLSLIYITHILTRPINTFNQLIDAIQSHKEDFSKIPFGSDEFGELGRKIANAYEQLESNKRFKQEMTQNIAHELKTPVTGIKACLETIKHSPEMEQQQMMYFLDKAYMQTVRLSSLIANVSTLNKLDEGADKFNIEEISLIGCVREIQEEIGYKLTSNKIKFIVSIDASYTIVGSYFLVYYLFKNLIDNAIEHGGSGIEVHLECSKFPNQSPAEYEFLFYDTGKGVPAENLPRLFERFYRVERGRTRKNGGSGLGLSIVKNAVLFHKGNIVVENRAMGGLQFRFTLCSLDEELEQKRMESGEEE